MSRVYSHYFLDTGLFTGRRSRVPEGQESSITPRDGCAFIAGSYDLLSQKVDIETAEVIDYLPPQPSAEHEWINRRWVLTARAKSEIDSDQSARIELEQIDKAAIRYLMEAEVGVIDEEGKRRLEAMVERKAELRQRLKNG